MSKHNLKAEINKQALAISNASLELKKLNKKSLNSLSGEISEHRATSVDKRQSPSETAIGKGKNGSRRGSLQNINTGVQKIHQDKRSKTLEANDRAGGAELKTHKGGGERNPHSSAIQKLLTSNKVNLSFGGAGFMGVYEMGAAYALTRHGKSFLDRVELFAGSSAGCLIASLFSFMPELDIARETLLAKAFRVQGDLHREVKPTCCRPCAIGYDLIERLCMKIVEYGIIDAESVASKRNLCVCMTKCNHGCCCCNGQEVEFVTRFNNLEELLSCLKASSAIPCCTTKLRCIRIRNFKYIDGGFTQAVPLPENGLPTITCTPFACYERKSKKPMDICPMLKRTCCAIPVNDQKYKLGFYNLVTLKRAIRPPSLPTMYAIFLNGFKDGYKFLLDTGNFNDFEDHFNLGADAIPKSLTNAMKLLNVAGLAKEANVRARNEDLFNDMVERIQRSSERNVDKVVV